MEKMKMLVLAAVAMLSFGLMAQPALAACDVNGGFEGGINCARGDKTPDSIFDEGGVFTTVVNVLLFIIGAISVIMIIFAGIKYTTSSGDAAKVGEAKNTILYAVIGLIVAVLAYAIVNFVLKRFLGDQ